MGGRLVGSSLRGGGGSQPTLVLKLGVLCSGTRWVGGRAGRLVSWERVSHSLRICRFCCEPLPAPIIQAQTSPDSAGAGLRFPQGLSPSLRRGRSRCLTQVLRD